MPKTVKEMLDAANAEVPKITPAQAQEMIAKGNTLVVDLRDGTEVAASGKVAGAVNHSRGVLEFKADPDSPTFDKQFAARQDRDPLLRLRRPRRARRQAAEGDGLREGLQPRRLQGLGRGRRQGGEELSTRVARPAAAFGCISGAPARRCV